MLISFEVENQIITRTDTNSIVRDSQNYLRAGFSFSEEWSGTKTAVFASESGDYNVILDAENGCYVPWEVLTDSSFYVSVFCADLVTANQVRINTIKSGYNGSKESRIPTKDVYQQIIAMLDALEMGVVDKVKIGEMVDRYLSNESVRPAQVVEFINNYFTEHKAEYRGEDGFTYTPKIKNITTLAAGSDATASIELSGTDALISLGLPKGKDGTNGINGTSITGVAKTATNGLVDTYTIRYSNGTTSTFDVTNGKNGAKGNTGVGISKIEFTKSVDKIDTYTITLTNGNTSTFDVINGTDGVGIADVVQSGEDVAITLTDGTVKHITIKNGKDAKEYDDTPIWKVQGELGAKNLIPYPYYEGDYKRKHGATFTAENGIVTMSGTSTDYAQYFLAYNNANLLKKGDYIFSYDGELNENIVIQLRLGDGNVAELYKTKSIQTFTIEEDGLELSLKIVISPSKPVDSTIKLMIRYASDIDSTWQPYAPTNKVLKQELDTSVDNIYAIQGRFGAKNLLEQPYANKLPFYSGGISFTEGDDGGIVINGTSTTYIALQIMRKLEALPHGEYILSVQEDLPSGVVLQFGYVTTSGTVTFVQKGYNALTTHSMKVTLDDEFDGNLVCVRIGINSSTTVDNLAVHPMLRYAADTDDTWQPYAMSNKQLTDAILSNGEEITNESTVSTELKPNYFHLFTNAVESLTITLPSNRRPWNEFNFAFTTSSSGCNLALPSSVTWLGGTPTIEKNYYYEVSIMNDKAVISP